MNTNTTNRTRNHSPLRRIVRWIDEWTLFSFNPPQWRREQR